MHLALETEYLMSATSKTDVNIFWDTELSNVLESDFHAAFKIMARKLHVSELSSSLMQYL